MKIIEEYLQALRDQGARPETVELAVDDMVQCYRINGRGYVLVTASVTVPGEWWLPVDVVERLRVKAETEQVACRYVFLIVRQDGRGANGYIVDDFDSTPVKRAFDISEGQYHIREKRHFDSLRLLLSTEKVADLLLRNIHAD